MPLTNEQMTAVTDRGGGLLVSAAAGSGKTKVLVERLFSYIEEEHCSVDDFLIITYTKAAAAELRGKIARELTARVAAQPENAHLRRQMFRVYQADIKTVDAFCAGLLRENIHLLPSSTWQHNLTPDFRVLDEQEAQTVKERVLERTLDRFYQKLEAGDEQALHLAETLGAGRDDRVLAKLVLELHTKIQSHPYPLRWLEEVGESWRTPPRSLDGCDFGRVMIRDALRQAAFWSGQLRAAVTRMEGNPAVYKAYADRFLDVADQLDRYPAAAAQGWDAMTAIRPAFARMGQVRGEENAADKERARAVLESCKKALEKLTAPFAASEADYLEDLRMMAPAMLALVDLTADFTRAYQLEKLRRNTMDFSDQEHYAIKILLDNEGRPTELAQQVAARYREVMVDEYQDTNEVQNWIFRAVSRREQNLFTVGDVKQSIYRFRLADPTIFLEKYRTYAPAGEAAEGEPRKVLLSRNFRSRQEVLAVTNFVFANILSTQMGEMEYGSAERLCAGAEGYPERDDTAAEFHLVNVEDTAAEKFDRTEVEANFVAQRIRRLLDEHFQIRAEDGGTRDVTAEDIVILMRSPGPRLKIYIRAMQKAGIPCGSGENEDFFATVEIAVMFSLLQIVDNPRQDVPLISVLRSPLMGFTPDRLAEIRALQPEGDYYEALLRDDHTDTKAFLALLEELREFSRDAAADQLLWKIYGRCHALAIFGAMEGGAERRRNLIALASYAAESVGVGRGGLFDFVSHLRTLLERGTPPALSTRQSAGGVRIMSIHKSKGLEFPVVILCDLHKPFNTNDQRSPVLVHPQLGLGTECVDLTRHIRYDSISKMAVKNQLERENKSEEMRILYVAMTRAKEKLIMVECGKKMEKRVRDLASVTDCPVPPEAVGSAKCLGDWILLPLLCTQAAAPIHQWAGIMPDSYTPADHWQVQVWTNPSAAARQEQEEKTAATSVPFDPAALETEYRWPSACTTPGKVTATQLKGREVDSEIAEGAASDRRLGNLARPRFLSDTAALSATEKGTAVHLALQYLDFSLPADPAAIDGALQAMTERRLMTAEQAAAVDREKMAAFLASPLCRRIRSASQVWREYRFTLLVDASLYDPRCAGEEMMLQGVADCAFDTPEGLVIVDFKTDRLRPGEEAARVELYRPQLSAYAKALEKVLERPVAEKILYFFHINSAINL